MPEGRGPQGIVIRTKLTIYGALIILIMTIYSDSKFCMMRVYYLIIIFTPGVHILIIDQKYLHELIS